MEGLHAYTAGAGTGKTYTICEEIAEAIADGLDPARIIATTFTEKAAAELKGRVLAKIWEGDSVPPEERAHLAERLELAAIGTVHSVGYQLLKRYALTIGLSPRLHVLDEEASDRHLNQLLAEMSPASWEEVVERGRPLEQSDPQDLARDLLDEKRTNRIAEDDFRDQMADSADRLCEILAPDGPDPSAPPPDLLPDLAEDAREQIAALEDETDTTADALDDLADLARIDDPTWRDVVEAGKIDAGKRSGANDCLDDLRAFSSQVGRMPGLHEDIRDFVDALTEQTLDIEEQYREYKRNRGLLDFTDLEDFLLRALEQEAVREDLGESFDVVFVDEFQDSNPIQLAIFLQLHEAVGTSYWVGDEKQSIYGFRDADLDLVRDAWDLVPDENLHQLGTSYRSQAGLVDVLGTAFEPLFGDEARLEADREPADGGLERWLLEAGNNDEERRALADGIATLRAEGTGLGDIAVLTRSNRNARSIGDALAERGIPSVVSRPGLLGTRECTAAIAGLEVVADREDGLAAATLLHMLGSSTEETPSWLLDRLERRTEERASSGRPRDPPWPDHPTLEALDSIDTQALPPSAVLEQVIQRIDLPTHLPRWGDPRRRKAHLDALVSMARDYEDQMADEGRGASLRGLVTWLEDQADDDEDTYPTPEGLDAVTVSTYHAAKGKEWPTVILTELGFDPSARPWEPRVEGGRVADGRPLADRHLSYWPWPFGTYGWGDWGGRVKGSGLDDAARATPEGQALQADEEAEAERLLYVGMTRARDRLVLAHRGDPEDSDTAKYEWLDRTPMDDILDPRSEPGEHDLDQADTTGVLRRFRPPDDEVEECGPGTAVDLDEPDPLEDGHLPRYRQPSDEEPADEESPIETTLLPGPEPGADRIQADDWAALGEAVHAYLAAVPSLRDSADEAKREVAQRCLRNHDVEADLPAASLVEAGDRLEAWVEETYGSATWRTEIPVTAPAGQGQQWVGEADLVLELSSGELVIVDHKIRPNPEGMWAEEGRKYQGQIRGYREALEGAGAEVRDGWVLFVLGGGAAKVTVES